MCLRVQSHRVQALQVARVNCQVSGFCTIILVNRIYQDFATRGSLLFNFLAFACSDIYIYIYIYMAWELFESWNPGNSTFEKLLF